MKAFGTIYLINSKETGKNQTVFFQSHVPSQWYIDFTQTQNINVIPVEFTDSYGTII